MILIRPKPTIVSKKALTFFAFLLGFFAYGLHPPNVYAADNISATVENMNIFNGTYDVVVNASSSSGVKSVTVPTWYTDSNGKQVTLYWYDAIKRSDGKYVAKINYKNHDFQRHLNSHVYMETLDGRTKAISIGTTDIPRPEVKREIQNLNAQTGEYDVVIHTNIPAKYIDSVHLPTWSTAISPWGNKTDQDDINWYDLDVSPDGVYRKHISIGNHDLDRTIRSHIYFFLKSGEQFAAAVQDVTLPTTKKVYVNENTKIAGKYKFIPHWIDGVTTFETFGPAEWGSHSYDYGGANIVHYTQPKDNMKGKIGVIYHNVGIYDGKTIDLKITINDWKRAKDYNGYLEYTEGVIAHVQQAYFYVDQTWQFLDANTGKPVKTTGYMTINDIDSNQGVGFDKATSDAIKNYYVTNNTQVRFNLYKDNQGFYSQPENNIEPDDESGQVTFTYENLDKIHFAWNLINRPRNEYLHWPNPALGETFTGEYFSYTGIKLPKSEIPTPEKFIQEEGSNVLVKESKLKNITDKIHYVIYQTINKERKSNYYPTFSIKDTLPNGVDYVSSKIINSKKQDVTNQFNIIRNGQTIEFKAKTNWLQSPSFYGTDYRIDIMTKPQPLAKLESLIVEKTITFKNKATTEVDGYNPQISNEVVTTYETGPEPPDGTLIHYDHEKDSTGMNKSSWIKTEKIQFTEHKTWTSDWKDVEVTKTKIDEYGNEIKYTEIERKDFGHYTYTYDYKIVPRKDLTKTTDYGTFNYVSYDGKTISGTGLKADQKKNLVIRMPYIVPRTTIYSQRLTVDTDDITPEGNGLPFKLIIGTNEQLVQDPSNDFKNVKVNVKIYDTKHNKVAYSTVVNYNDLSKELSGKLNVSDFKHGNQVPLEVKLTIAENPDKRELITENGKFISFGYVASHDTIQGNIPIDKANENTKNTATVKKPVRTVKEKDKDVQILYETLTASISSKIKTKTGYGIQPKIATKYQSEINTTNQNIPLVLEANKQIKSSEDSYGEMINNKLIIRLINNQLPKVAIQKPTGKVRQIEFVDPNNSTKSTIKDLQKNEINGGNRLYIPIWHEIGTEKLNLKAVDKDGKVVTIGVNKMKLNMPTYIDIFAYMYNPSESKTVGHDEMLLKPNIKNN